MSNNKIQLYIRAHEDGRKFDRGASLPFPWALVYVARAQPLPGLIRSPRSGMPFITRVGDYSGVQRTDAQRETEERDHTA